MSAASMMTGGDGDATPCGVCGGNDEMFGGAVPTFVEQYGAWILAVCVVLLLAAAWHYNYVPGESYFYSDSYTPSRSAPRSCRPPREGFGVGDAVAADVNSVARAFRL